MQEQQRLMLLKLITISVAALAVLFNLRSAASSQDQGGRLFEMAGMTLPLEQRIGVDDGAVFAVHFSGDTRGTLDACG